MVKNALIILGILTSIFLMLVISLVNGFKIDNLSYGNINIQGLYLKYDKKLIIDTRNIAISYGNENETVDMKIKFSIESFFDNYFIEVYEYVLFEPYLKASGKFVADFNNISLDKIKDIVINDFALQFNKNLKFIKAENCYVNFLNNNFYFTFSKPQYEGVSLDGSRATILDFDRLKLELTSNDNLKKPLLELLSNYQVHLPLTQEYGENSVATDIIIPFNIEKEIEINSQISLNDAKITLYSLPLFAKNFKIDLQGNQLLGEGVLLKSFDTNTSLSYQGEVKFTIDFTKKFVQGKFSLDSMGYKDLYLSQSDGNFSIDFHPTFFTSDIQISNTKAKLKEEFFLIHNGSSHYQDEKKTFSTNLKLQHQSLPLELEIQDTFSLTDIDSKGEGTLSYQEGKLFTDSLSYKIDFKDDTTKATFDIVSLSSEFFNSSGKLQNLRFNYEEDHLNGKLDGFLLDTNTTKIEASDINFLVKLEAPFLVKLDTNDSKLFINTIDSGIKGSELVYQNDSIKLTNSIQNKYFDGKIFSDIQLKDKKATGKINLETPNTREFAYSLNFIDDILLHIPALDLKLSYKEDETLKLLVNNFIPLQDSFDFLETNQKSKLSLTKVEDKPINIKLQNISIFLDKYLNQSQKDENTQNQTPIEMNLENGFIQLNDYKFYFDTVTLQKDKHNNIHAELVQNNSKILYDKISQNSIIQSKKIESSYLNLIYGKDILKHGYLDFFITGNDFNNIYNGEVNLYDTTLIKMQFVDNLLLFLNSTPAFINPLLALPTLFRMTQNSFELGGYYLEKGRFNFQYHQTEKKLNILNIKTKGKINDFSGDIFINLLQNSIDGKLRVSTLKDYAKVVNYIPIVNYIFLDKEGNFSIPVIIGGTLENPSYNILTTDNKEK